MALEIGGTAGAFSVCERLSSLRRGLGEHCVFCLMIFFLGSKLKNRHQG